MEWCAQTLAVAAIATAASKVLWIILFMWMVILHQLAFRKDFAAGLDHLRLR
jgi:hypothetical protein